MVISFFGTDSLHQWLMVGYVLYLGDNDNDNSDDDGDNDNDNNDDDGDDDA